MKYNHLKISKLIIFICLCFISQTAFCVKETELELLLLPPYCKARQESGESINYKQWKKKLGDDFINVHHYCHGLKFLMDSYKAHTKKEKAAALNEAIQQITYTQEHSDQNFLLQPRMAYDKGRVFEELGDIKNALESYQYSIKLDPSRPFPYAAASDLLKKQNSLKEASALIEQGLKYKPYSKMLLKRQAKLSNNK